ncbi:flagellar hook protein FlgE [Pseudobutyrivibrio sp. ACV-2]|uniref:flagellar hook protein FlgE n=1 Tax=Pseudobutyrivibrio sp. ACV-2 TaxID=1520801 RepID=UPI000894D527|nr:flagellar hook-basal body complex protein [Pseudobutyrivibrio sp. ACV-2]SDZ85833.1 flagellar hook protein FlgE [Pseudobutyrivibrio sp. ACV-2]
MMRSLFSGVSGLKTHQTKMDVIGNNISNVNTVAFKSSATTFSDIMYQTTQQASGASGTRGGTNAKQIGLGVTNGATKVSITSSGAAQSTGDALDIRLTDSKSTNFFIVNNGAQNLFTRAGSFYIDGMGNLAMTTTGYIVQGWQVDPQNPASIIKDTVSPLRVMKSENLTSAPEATTAANFAGVLDKNDSQFNSTGGYVRSFTLFDNLGYSYTAKFSIKLQDGTNGIYTVELTSVLDQDNNDILKKYTSQSDGSGGSKSLSDIFGTDIIVSKSYKALSDDYKFTTTDPAAGTGDIKMTSGTKTYTYNATDKAFVNDADSTDVLPLTVVCGLSAEDMAKNIEISYKDENTLAIKSPSIGYNLKFDPKEGTLMYAGKDAKSGGKSLVMNSSLLGPSDEKAAISDIEIDFSKLLNYDNGGTSTAVANKGIPDGVTMRGEGRKLGTMTGLSIQTNGEIYGSYSNGNTVLLGQIAVAQFANASGLLEMGDNCYNTTLNSGDFDGIGIDISADGSSMNTGQLEMSNVDLSSEFTDMITTQRGFQANSRIITVSDTLLEELINLKR